MQHNTICKLPQISMPDEDGMEEQFDIYMLVDTNMYPIEWYKISLLQTISPYCSNWS